MLETLLNSFSSLDSGGVPHSPQSLGHRLHREEVQASSEGKLVFCEGDIVPHGDPVAGGGMGGDEGERSPLVGAAEDLLSSLARLRMFWTGGHRAVRTDDSL